MRHFLLISILFPLGLLSQNKRTVFVEAGSSLNQSFNPKETRSGKEYAYNYSILTCIPIEYDTESKTHYKSAASFYFRIGLEKAFKMGERVSLSFPFVFGYNEKKENIETEAIQYPEYNSPEKFQITYKNEQKMGSMMFGPKITMKFNKWSWFENLNVNMDLPFYSKYSRKMNSDFGNFEYKDEGRDYLDPVFTVVLKSGLLYQMNEKIGIGLTNDIFFYRIEENHFKGFKQNNHLFNLGYGDNSTLLNIGARLQYSF